MSKPPLSFSKYSEKNDSKQNEITMAASRNASLKNALSGSNNGVHLRGSLRLGGAKA